MEQSINGGAWFRISMRHIKTRLIHEKKPLTFHYTGCLIGILLMVYDNPYIAG